MKKLIHIFNYICATIIALKVINVLFGKIINRRYLKNQFSEAVYYRDKNIDEITQLNISLELKQHMRTRIPANQRDDIDNEIFMLKVKLSIAHEENDHWLVAIDDLGAKLG